MIREPSQNFALVYIVNLLPHELSSKSIICITMSMMCNCCKYIFAQYFLSFLMSYMFNINILSQFQNSGCTLENNFVTFENVL